MRALCLGSLRLVALALGVLVLAPVAPAAAESVALLDTEWEAAVARARLVLGAQKTVDLASFIVGREPFSLTSMALLRDARRRGVRVRLLVDWQSSRLPEAVEAHLLAEGVQIRTYHPFRLRRPDWLSRRMHDKLLVVDSEAFIVGGRNIESPYFGLGRQIQQRDYLDTDVVVTGASAAQASGYFDDLWASREVRRSQAAVTKSRKAAAAAALDSHLAWFREREAGFRDTLNAAPPVWHEVGAVTLLFDPPGLKGEAPGVAEALRELLHSARRSVVIETPYLIPTRGLAEALAAAIDRGVAVRILTNSLATTDHLWVQAVYVGERKRWVQRGIELWEYLGKESLHTKAAVIDDDLAVVTSFNLDPRSERLNTELAVVVHDRGFAAELLAAMATHLASSARIDALGRPVGHSERYPGVSCAKIWKLRLLSPLAWLIRSQL